MSAEDVVTVSLEVAVAPAMAFRVLTEEVDVWWGRGPEFRNRGPESVLRFEPGVGGRFLEHDVSGQSIVGEISVWEPGVRLVMSWHPSNFAVDESLEVEISFHAVPAGTCVTVTLRGWASLRSDHPARHGLAGRELLMMRRRWWAELLGCLKLLGERCKTAPSQGEPKR